MRVNDDRMSVILNGFLSTNDLGPLIARIHSEMTSLGIHEIPDIKNLGKMLYEYCKNGSPDTGLVIKEGRKSIPPRSGEIQWAASFFDGEEYEHETGESHQSGAERRAVKKGQLLARMILAQDGEPGEDVFGKPVAVPRAKRVEMIAGPNVKRVDQGKAQIFFSEIEGRLRWSSSVIAVDPVETLSGGLKPEAGLVKSPGAVVIDGDVLAGSRLESGGDIEVLGTVEPAEIKAGGDLVVLGGITCSDFGRINVKGGVRSRFIQSSNIEAGEDIVVAGDIVNSNVVTRGRVRAVKGRVIGGRIKALAGIEVVQTGSVGRARTELVVAEDFLLDRQREEKEKEKEMLQLRAELETKRATLDLLMSRQRTLTPEQREQTTVLFAEQIEIEGKVEELQDEIDDLKTHSHDRAVPTILIKSMAHAGTTLRIRGREMHLKRSIRGPVRGMVSFEKVVLVPEKR